MAYRHIGYNVLAFGAALASAIALNVATTSAPAIAQDICPNTEYIPAATATRSVEFPQFGVQIAIPENFRTMALQDDGVSILAPYEFEIIQCMIQGIPGPGIEILPTDFHRIENPQGLSAMEYAQAIADQYNVSGGTAFDPKISSQTIDGVEVAILEVASGYDSFNAWYQLNGTDSLVEISSFNDSQLHPRELLSQTQFMRTAPN